MKPFPVVICCLILALLISGCSMRERWQPSVRIVAIEYQAELGTLEAQLRINNRQDSPRSIESLSSRLWINDELIAEQQGEMKLQIPSRGVEVVRIDADAVSETVAEALTQLQPVSYFIEVTFKTSDSSRLVKAEHEGRLDPAPGAPGRYR